MGDDGNRTRRLTAEDFGAENVSARTLAIALAGAINLLEIIRATYPDDTWIVASVDSMLFSVCSFTGIEQRRYER
jgi:hypothetical protein